MCSVYVYVHVGVSVDVVADPVAAAPLPLPLMSPLPPTLTLKVGVTCDSAGANARRHFPHGRQPCMYQPDAPSMQALGE